MHPYLSSGVTLSLWANSLKRELCPVTALFTWLLITGLFIYICVIDFISWEDARVDRPHICTVVKPCVKLL